MKNTGGKDLPVQITPISGLNSNTKRDTNIPNTKQIQMKVKIMAHDITLLNKTPITLLTVR